MAKKEIKAVPARTLAEVNQEYTNKCAEIGHAEFQRALLSAKLNELYAGLSKLNEEAIQFKEATDGNSDTAK